MHEKKRKEKSVLSDMIKVLDTVVDENVMKNKIDEREKLSL